MEACHGSTAPLISGNEGIQKQHVNEMVKVGEMEAQRVYQGLSFNPESHEKSIA